MDYPVKMEYKGKMVSPVKTAFLERMVCLECVDSLVDLVNPATRDRQGQ